MLRPDYPVGTERLVLRPFEEGDLDDTFAVTDGNRPLYIEPRTREEAAKPLARWSSQRELTEPGQCLVLAVVLEDRVIGKVELTWRSREQGEIGYILNEEFRGNGYAREAGRQMLKFGFDHLGLQQIIARCDPSNEPSRRVLERLGMSKVEEEDLYMYVMLADEYRKLK
ncbi:GNAT family N-acetyltransferase [Lentzea alba]|uniref:GNAT family N-acetyltransferase n=1 Tax=Lentzea alba TaxID=2714351 RepID=UPI0039BFCD2E